MLPKPKIDIHTHILPKTLPKWKGQFGYGGFIELCHYESCKAKMIRDDGKFFREIESNCWDPAARILDNQKSKIDIQILSTVPIMFSYWVKAQDGLTVSRYLNDQLADTVKNYPGNFLGLATVPLQDPELACLELTRAVKDLGLSGVQIGSHVGEYNLNDSRFDDFYMTAQELGAAIFVHPWDMMGQDKMQKYWLPWLVGMPAEVSLAICSMIFGGVFERFSTLKVAFAHGGGSFPITLGRIEHGFKSRPDLVAIDNKKNPRDYLGRFFVDSLVHDKRSLKFILELFGEDSVLLGSDYPFPLGEQEPGALLKEANLDLALIEKIQYHNVKKWLGKDRM